jgi:hypothetical protein
MLIRFLTLVIIVLLSPTTFAHHSDAGIDENSIVTLKGKVVKFSWRQPHVYLYVEIMDNGKPVKWDIQLAAINVLSRTGWSSDSLRPGDSVSVKVNPAENGRSYGKLVDIERSDGSSVTVRVETTVANASKASSLDGQWIADKNRSGPSYPGGFDGFFREQLVLTEAGKVASQNYDPLSTSNPEATCVGRPTPAALVSSSGYVMAFDLSEAKEKIIIHSEWFNEKRTVYMDGRSHPDTSETFTTGHSIGYWDNDTLVVDTQNFEPHRSPYQTGVPSGLQKHVIEKYRLIEDGAAMSAEFILEDPEFLAEAMHHSRVLIYSPQLEMLISDCDPESSSQFLK